MENNQSFFVGRQPFLFKIKGGPEPPDLAFINRGLNRLAEVYTRGPDNTQEATWRKYRHYKELSDLMDILMPKIKLFYHPPYGMYNVDGSLKIWKSLRNNAKKWKKAEGPGSLTQLHDATLAEEEIDGQPYASDGSQDNAPEEGGSAEHPIVISDNSDFESEGRPPLAPRGPPQERRPFGNNGPSTRRPSTLNGNNPRTLLPRGQFIKEQEQKLMNKPKQLMNPSCELCAKKQRECYVEDERILRDYTRGRRKKMRCILCIVRNRVCVNLEGIFDMRDKDSLDSFFLCLLRIKLAEPTKTLGSL
ncbi:hypothetical protein IW261DRAFT_1666414 [Armillaria novae-zelandiae]|uniref:Uncharacterized protein n=1 Tax=Armillaria novae-zelandiae TaxID=153914 RepID=A0AA39NUG5_9AGAR|nr:hypothetical protein IW261DRAFT_1666414 [Armillaria novae-zelandiae]